MSNLTITTYNVIGIPCLDPDDPRVAAAQLLSNIPTCVSNPTWFGRSMAKRMKALEKFLRSQANRNNGSDVVVLQEAFTSNSGVFNDRAMEAVIRSNAFPYVATGDSSKLGNDVKSLVELGLNNSVKRPPRGAFSSGLVLFSRYPILATRTVSFGKDCTLDDCGANKGILFVRLQLPDGNTAEIFATHMQANEKADKVRQRQVKTFTRFMEQTRSISPFRFYVGDFNFRGDQSESFTQFQQKSGTLHAGQICMATADCPISPDGGKARRKIGGDSVDHQFFSTNAPGYAIIPSNIRLDDVAIGNRTLSDHQYLKIRYRLIGP